MRSPIAWSLEEAFKPCPGSTNRSSCGSFVEEGDQLQAGIHLLVGGVSEELPLPRQHRDVDSATTR